MNPERDVAPPQRRADGSWRYPIQVVIQSQGEWETGYAVFALVGYADDLAHQREAQRFLI